jgi:type IV pilus assembly protein PilM
MPRFFRAAKLGVDLGSSSVKVISLNGRKVSLAALMDIPKSSLEDENALTNTLSNFFKDLNIIGKDVVVQIPGTMSFIRTLTLPLMPKNELKEAVQWEIKRQLPYSSDEAVYDYIAKETPDGIVATFASAERKNTQRFIDPLINAGLNVTAVDINPLCLMRVFPLQSPGNIILVDIGAKNMEINIVKSGVLRLSRSVNIGGETIREYLLSEGFMGTEADKIMMNGPLDKIRDILDQLIREILRSIDYYKATFKEKDFSEAILTGGGAINYAVKSYFSQVFDFPVKAPNPFENLVLKDESLRPLGPRFSTAIGLARRAL